MPVSRSSTSSATRHQPNTPACLVFTEGLGQALNSLGSLILLWEQGDDLTSYPSMDITLTKQDSLWDSVSGHSTAGSSHLRPLPSALLPDGSEACGPDSAPLSPQHSFLMSQQAGAANFLLMCTHVPYRRTLQSDLSISSPGHPALLLTILSCPPSYLSLLSAGLAHFSWQIDKTPRATKTLKL